MDVGKPVAVRWSEVDHLWVVDLPRWEKRITSPVSDIVFRTVDDAPTKSVFGFVVAPEQVQQILEPRTMVLVRSTAHQEEP